GIFTSPSSSITGWLTSAIATTESVAQLGTGPSGATTLGASAGLVIDGQSIQAMNSGTLPDLGPPGVPEPETWALLLAMMAFTTLWVRRRQDDDVPLETSITA
ncbi:MAG: PEP-CTERM sorting domain-containing protein, partial [Mariprofundaceae bacterium]|nr:PEP-CTERM sorting domain-containing protein [Mariprofundaceae bacterium]